MRSDNIIDITHELNSQIAEWPGDAEFTIRRTCLISEGATVNLSEIALSAHTGTHVDAAWHFDDSGCPVGCIPLDVLVGPAVVIDVAGIPEIRPEHLATLQPGSADRLLLRTDAWQDPASFPSTIPVLHKDTPALLRSLGTRLLGVDVPSVDQIDSKDLPIHKLLGEFGIVVLEGLQLKHVAPGAYELIALPLKLAGADGAPVRAILRRG